MKVGAIFWRKYMLHEWHQSRRLRVLLLFCGLLFFIKADPAFAYDLKDIHQTVPAPQAGAAQAAGQESAAQGATGTRATATVPQDHPVISSAADDGGSSATAGDTGQAGSSATPPAPLTPGQKFKYSL